MKQASINAVTLQRRPTVISVLAGMLTIEMKKLPTTITWITGIAGVKAGSPCRTSTGRRKNDPAIAGGSRTWVKMRCTSVA